jgi:adenylate cyclase
MAKATVVLCRDAAESPCSEEMPLVSHAKVLVVDDIAANRTLLSAILVRKGYEAVTAHDGPTALALLRTESFDAVLLDLMMPGMDGTEVLRAIQADAALKTVPVLMVSAQYEIESVVRCIQLGAVDYIAKPVDATLLEARVSNCVERKQMRDMERAYLSTIESERQRSRDLLCNLLPRPIAERMLAGESAIAEVFDEVTVLFADIVDFTAMAEAMPPAALLTFLNALFTRFDTLADLFGIEKIKTIGDAYMAVAGLPLRRVDHVDAAAILALAFRDEAAKFSMPDGRPVRIRIGMHTGAVVAGVVGHGRLAYDLWGDVVNTASRMESHGVPGEVQISQAVRDRLGPDFLVRARGLIDIKGKGPMELFLLTGEKNPRPMSAG